MAQRNEGMARQKRLGRTLHQSALEMCNLSWTPHSSLEKDNSLNHSRVSPKMGCLDVYITKD